MRNKLFVISRIWIAVFCLLIVNNTEAGLSDFLNFSNIPKHPLLEKVQENTSTINGSEAKTIIYKAPDNIDITNVIDFYTNVFLQRGWKKNGEYMSGNYSVVGFSDDDMRVFSIKIGRSPLINGVFVTVYYLPEGMKKWIFKDNPEDNDMPGKDFSWLPRYPGSIRIQSVEDYTGIIKIDYMIPGYSCINCVSEFYRDNMIKSDWQLINSNRQDKEDIQENLESNMARTKSIITQMEESGKFNDMDFSKYEKYFNSQKESPSEIHSFHFEKKGATCAIGMSYKEAQSGVDMVSEQLNSFYEKINEMPEEERAVIEEQLQKQLSLNRAYYQMSQSARESVMVSVIYMPKRPANYSPNRQIISNFLRRK
ncbi:MAG: hypothetical protein ABIA97_04235 [Candidatus Omnitrophota bacterium]